MFAKFGFISGLQLFQDAERWFEGWHWKFICNETFVWDFSILVIICLQLNNCCNVIPRNLLKSNIQQRQYFSRETRNFHGKLLIMEEGIFWPFSSNSAHLEHPERVKYCWLLDLSRFQGTGDKLPLQQWQTDPSFISWLLFSFGIILKAKVSLKNFYSRALSYDMHIMFWGMCRCYLTLLLNCCIYVSNYLMAILYYIIHMHPWYVLHNTSESLT